MNKTNYEYETAEGGIVITKYNKEASKEVTIPNEIDKKKVTGIRDRAFNRSGIKSAILPKGITFIRNSAFTYNELTNIKIPDSGKTIGEEAFRDIINFETINLSDSVQSIGEKAFQEAGIKNMTIGNGVKTIGKNAFAKNQIAQINFGNSATEVAIETIGEAAFKYNQFKAVVLPENVNYGMTTDKIFGIRVTYLAEAAHSWEKENTQYASPDDFKWKKTKDGKSIIILNYLGTRNKVSSESSEGTSLEVDIPPQIQGFPVIDVCFSSGVKKENKVKIKHINISDIVTCIEEKAFSENKLKHVTIPKGITFAALTAFMHNELTGVTLPESLKSIRAKAFENNKIKSLILPDRLTHLGDRAFRNKKNANLSIGKMLTRIIFITLEKNSLTELVIPPNIEYICFGLGAMSYVFGKNKLTKVIFPEGISVCDRAFYKNKLTSVIRPKNAAFVKADGNIGGSFDAGEKIVGAPDAAGKYDTHCSPSNFPPKYESLQKHDNDLNCSVTINTNAQQKKFQVKRYIVNVK